MATTQQFQERLRRAVREAVQKCLAEGDLPEVPQGESRLTTIEALALAAGDAVSLEVFDQQSAESGTGGRRTVRTVASRDSVPNSGSARSRLVAA